MRGVPFSMSGFSEMARLYQGGLTMQKVSERLGVCQASVCKALKIHGVKARPRPGFSEKAIENRNRARERRWRITINHDLTPEKAYILGVLGPGDGDVGISRQSHPRIRLGVTDKDFADEFARCFQVAYGVKPTKIYNQVTNRQNRQPINTVENHRWPIFKDILSYNRGDLKTFRHGGEKVPNAVKNGTPEIKTAYLKAFFDSQGGVTGGSISAAKKNGEVLKEIQLLLLDFGIKSTIYDYTKTHSGTFRLNIYADSKKIFCERIGFSIRRKQERLEKIASLPTRLIYTKQFECFSEQAKELKKQGFGYKRIAKILGISCWTVQSWIKSNKLGD